jgi:3-methyladenine DNA glycosylase AlkD
LSANGQAFDIAEEVDRDLRAAGNPARAVSEKSYLKSDLEFLGCGVPAIRAAAKAARRAHADLDHDTLIDLVDRLWSVPVHERRMAAVEMLLAFPKLLEPDDIPHVERLVRESRTWALVDVLATGVTAGLMQRYPELSTTLDRWVADPDFWVRRAAMLALLPPLRQGAGDFARFARYADAMLEEKEFFIRKAIGWVLRETAKKQPLQVYEWLIVRADRASGLTVREAVKYLPTEQREAVLRARTGIATAAAVPAGGYRFDL